MKILILGSSGFLGKYIYYKLKKNFLVFSTGLRRRRKDFNNFLNLKKLILKLKPNIIINCSGLTDIEKCQKNPILSKKINVNILKKIFKLKKYLDFKLIHFSTDQIYNPKKNKKNNENNLYLPINIYSSHKLKSEKICLKNHALIFRINIIGKSYSKKKSFSDWVYESLNQKKTINGFIDSFYSPLTTTTISEIIEKILLTNKYKYYGIYNLGSSSGISKFDLIKNFSKKLRIFDKKLVKKNLINDICITPRTKFNMLNIKKFENKFSIKLPSIKSELEKLVRMYKSNKVLKLN